jgi:two-component system chemotaxis sensor kinase CheA
VLNKAIEKGLIDNNATLTDSQVFDLLFEPGFSTAKEVSDISGRGVGMDVVKRNIQSLGGRIQVESQEGKGSKFKVILPLTLAILDGQLVRVGTEVYIIPLITIVESLQAKPELINRVSGGMIVYRLREDNVPVIPIYQLFNLLAETKDVDNALLVVVEADGQKIGLMVDDLLAQQQVVIKSLKDNYQQVSGISGATILGDGSVAMILDIPSMIAMAMKRAKKMQNKHHMSVEGELV